jgi:hypothetical protein
MRSTPVPTTTGNKGSVDNIKRSSIEADDKTSRQREYIKREDGPWVSDCNDRPLLLIPLLALFVGVHSTAVHPTHVCGKK